MIRLERIQMTFHTSEGDVVTTTRLTFDGVTSEYLTSASIAFLMGRETPLIRRILEKEGLITRKKGGVVWLEIFDAMWLIGLLSA